MNNIHLNSRILITGSTGGLGTALVSVLRDKGYKKLLTPNRTEMDLLSKESVKDYFIEHNPEAVLHLASIVFGLQGNLDNQMRSLDENTQINANLFSAVNLSAVQYVFFAGTVASYPFPYVEVPLKESNFFDGLPHSGEFGYAMSKRHAYSYLKILNQTKSVRFNYGVFTNLYGEHDRFNEYNGHVIPSLIMKAFKAKTSSTKFAVWGDGSAQRDFLHFNDAAEAIVLCLQLENTPSMINISSGKAVSIKEVTDLIIQAAKLDDLEFLLDKPVGITSRVVDNQNLKALGFVQKVSLKAGISNLYSWYSQNNSKVRQ